MKKYAIINKINNKIVGYSSEIDIENNNELITNLNHYLQSDKTSAEKLLEIKNNYWSVTITLNSDGYIKIYNEIVKGKLDEYWKYLETTDYADKTKTSNLKIDLMNAMQTLAKDSRVVEQYRKTFQNWYINNIVKNNINIPSDAFIFNSNGNLHQYDIKLKSEYSIYKLVELDVKINIENIREI